MMDVISLRPLIIQIFTFHQPCFQVLHLRMHYLRYNYIRFLDFVHFKLPQNNIIDNIKPPFVLNCFICTDIFQIIFLLKTTNRVKIPFISLTTLNTYLSKLFMSFVRYYLLMERCENDSKYLFLILFSKINL